jgi:hypothetical protein
MIKLSAYGTIKILFIIVALIVAPLVYITGDNYTRVMDARVNMPNNILIEEVIIPEIENESSTSRLSVVFNVTNPTGIDIYVYDITFILYMDNVSNPLSLDKPGTWDGWVVGLGGFSYIYDEDFIKVPSNSHARIFANMTVLGNTMFIENLNTTDSDGKYHPFIIASLRYTFKYIDVREVVHNIMYYRTEGITPKSLGD